MGAGATVKLKEAFESNSLYTVFANRFIAAVQGFQNGTAFKQWIGTDFLNAMKAINNRNFPVDTWKEKPNCAKLRQ